jgi:hypothetical protein
MQSRLHLSRRAVGRFDQPLTLKAHRVVRLTATTVFGKLRTHELVIRGVLLPVARRGARVLQLRAQKLVLLREDRATQIRRDVWRRPRIDSRRPGRDSYRALDERRVLTPST